MGFVALNQSEPKSGFIPLVTSHSTLGVPDVSTKGWAEGSKKVTGEDIATGVLKVLTEPMLDRETYEAEKPYLENVKTGLRNTIKAVAEAPLLTVKFPAMIARSVVGEPLRKWLSGEGEFTEEVKEGVKKEISGFAEMIVSGIPGLDKNWAENLFMNPDTVVFGKMLLKDVAKGTVKKVSDIVDRAEAWKAKQGTQIPTPTFEQKAIRGELSPEELSQSMAELADKAMKGAEPAKSTHTIEEVESFLAKEKVKESGFIPIKEPVVEQIKPVTKEPATKGYVPNKLDKLKKQFDELGIDETESERVIRANRYLGLEEKPIKSLNELSGSQIKELSGYLIKDSEHLKGIEPKINEEPKQTPTEASGFTSLEQSVVSGTMPEMSTEGGSVTIPNYKKAWTRFKEFWIPLSSVPQRKELLKIRYKTLGEVDIAEREGMKMFDNLKDLSPETKYDMFRFQKGEIPLEQLPDASTRTIALMIQSKFNELGQQLVDREMLTQEAYNANKNQYIPYLYLKYILGDKGSVAVGSSGKLDLRYLKSRKDLTKEQMKAIGLVEDISVSAPVGIMREQSDIAKFDMMSEIAANPEWTWQPALVRVEGYKRPLGIGKLIEEVKIAKEMQKQAPNVPEITERLNRLEAALNQAVAQTGNIPEGYVQLPNSKNYGDLAGAYVRKPIAQDIMPVVDIPSSVHSDAIRNIISAEKKAMGLFKIGKTALNVPTITRNTVSNVIQLNLSGIPLWEIPKHMYDAAEAMRRRNPDYNSAMQQGIFKTNWTMGEISEVLDVVRTMQKKPYPDMMAGVMKLAKFYGKIDDFFKMTKFQEGLSKGMTPTDAALEAQKWVMDYSLAHPSVKWARRHIMPFGTYQYKIMPLIAEAAATRPWVFAKYLAVPYLMAQLAQSTFDITDEDWKKLKDRLPSFIEKNKTVVPLWWKSPEGEVQWFDYQYFLPWQNLQQIGETENISDFMKSTGIGNPMLDVLSTLKSARGDKPPTDAFTGKDMYNQLDEPETKALKSVEFIYNKWAPTMLTRYGTLGKMLQEGQKDRFGRSITPEQVVGSLFGVNIFAPTEKQAKLEKISKIKQSQAQLMKIITDPQSSPAEKERAKKKFKAYSEDVMK